MALKILNSKKSKNFFTVLQVLAIIRHFKLNKIFERKNHSGDYLVVLTEEL
jgi:hypothetical protein